MNLECFLHPSGLLKEAEAWAVSPCFLQLNTAKARMWLLVEPSFCLSSCILPLESLQTKEKKINQPFSLIIEQCKDFLDEDQYKIEVR